MAAAAQGDISLLKEELQQQKKDLERHAEITESSAVKDRDEIARLRQALMQEEIASASRLNETMIQEQIANAVDQRTSALKAEVQSMSQTATAAQSEVSQLRKDFDQTMEDQEHEKCTWKRSNNKTFTAWWSLHATEDDITSTAWFKTFTDEPDSSSVCVDDEERERLPSWYVQAPQPPVIKPLLPLRGHLHKESPSAWLSKWDWRYFVLRDLRLLWWTSDKYAEEPAALDDDGGSKCKGSIDFAACPTEVEKEAGSPSIFILRPRDGHWVEGSITDTRNPDRVYRFDCAGSEHNRDKWMDVIRAHLKCAESL